MFRCSPGLRDCTRNVRRQRKMGSTWQYKDKCIPPHLSPRASFPRFEEPLLRRMLLWRCHRLHHHRRPLQESKTSTYSTAFRELAKNDLALSFREIFGHLLMQFECSRGDPAVHRPSGGGGGGGGQLRPVRRRRRGDPSADGVERPRLPQPKSERNSGAGNC